MTAAYGVDLTELPTWRAAFARYLAGEGTATVVVVGDSIAEGWGAGAPTYVNRWQGHARARCAGSAYGPGYIHAAYAGGGWVAADTTLSSAVASFLPAHGFGARGAVVSASGSVTWPALVCDRVRIFYGPDLFQGTMVVSIDGVDVATINMNAAPATDAIWDSGPLSLASHTVAVRNTHGSYTMRVTGAEFFAGDFDEGVRWYDGGTSGKGADYFGTAVTTGQWKHAADVDPDLLVVALGNNDAHTHSPGDFTTNLTNVLARADAAVSGSLSVLLVSPYHDARAAATLAPWQDYTDAVYAVAAARPDTAVVNLQDYWPVLMTDGSTNAGLMAEATNPVHPSPAGHALIGQIVGDVLALVEPTLIRPPTRTLDEVIAGSHRTLTRAVIVAGPATGETLPVTGGGVSVDFDADVTRSGRVTVAGLPQWEPVDATDALDVRAGTEILLEQGVVDDAGVEHWWSQGVFRPSKPTVTRDGGGLSIDVDLHDRSYSVKLASIRRRWVIAAAAPMLGSVATVLAEVAPWLPLNIDTTGDFPAGADIVVCEYGGDVWAAARQLAQSMGRWLHVDRDGVCVAPAIADPYATQAQALPALTSEQVGTDTSTIVNVVGATWTEPRPDDAPEGWVPEGGVQEWVDRESSTSIASAVGVRARAYSGDASVLHTPSHAAAAALSDGLRLRDLSRAASCTVVPDPRLDVGGAVTLDGYTYRVTSLDIDLSGGSPTSVDLGTARPDLARMLGAALKAGEERRLIEIVTSTSPLRARPIYEEGSEASVRWTDALAGVAVGDRIVVLHKGMGERVGVSLLDPKPLTQKFAGEVIGTVGGDDVTVGGDVTLRARVGSSGSYQTFSGGDVTLPEPDTTLNWSYISQSVPGSLGAAGSVTLAAFNEDRERINDLRGAVSYINARLVNLEANNT